MKTVRFNIGISWIKNILYISLVLFVLVANACSNDEPVNDEDNEIESPQEITFVEKAFIPNETSVYFNYNGNEYMANWMSRYNMYSAWPLIAFHYIYGYHYKLNKLNPEIEIGSIESMYIPYDEFARAAGIEKKPVCPKYCISAYAFDNCKNLKEVDLRFVHCIVGSNHAAFEGCDNLTDIYISHYYQPWVDSDRFDIDYDKVTLHVYKPDFVKPHLLKPWCNFKNVIWEPYEESNPYEYGGMKDWGAEVNGGPVYDEYGNEVMYIDPNDRYQYTEEDIRLGKKYDIWQ